MSSKLFRPQLNPCPTSLSNSYWLSKAATRNEADEEAEQTGKAEHCKSKARGLRVQLPCSTCCKETRHIKDTCTSGTLTIDCCAWPSRPCMLAQLLQVYKLLFDYLSSCGPKKKFSCPRLGSLHRSDQHQCSALDFTTFLLLRVSRTWTPALRV